MKIQLLTAVTILALSVSTAQAGRSNGGGGGVDLTNNSKNALAIGNAKGESGALGGFNITQSGGRAVAGSIYLENGACDCNLDDVKNRSRNAIAVGNATAGSIHVNTMSGYGY